MDPDPTRAYFAGTYVKRGETAPFSVAVATTPPILSASSAAYASVALSSVSYTGLTSDPRNWIVIAIAHQYVGTPLTPSSVESLERAIEAATRIQPLVERVRVRIDRERLTIRGPYRYGVLTEDLLNVEVAVRVGGATAIGELRYVPEFDYPLMYLKDIGEPEKS